LSKLFITVVTFRGYDVFTYFKVHSLLVNINLLTLFCACCGVLTVHQKRHVVAIPYRICMTVECEAARVLSFPVNQCFLSNYL